MFQTKAKVIKNIEVTKNYYKIALSSSRIAQAAKPGQFLQVKVNDGCEPLLRRPFSIHRISRKFLTCDMRHETCDLVEILYEVIGKGTQILSQKKRGEHLDIIGPLGNGFDFSSRAHELTSSRAIVVAGGIGVAPLFFLAEKLIKHATCDMRHATLVLIGAKTKSKILCEKELLRLGCEVKIATDDGSRGFKGKVTELLKEILVSGHPSTSSFGKLRTSLGAGRSPLDFARGRQVTGQKLATCDLRLATIYACGPRPMLKEISRISKEYKIPAQVSLEEHMACGIGACLGCAVKTQYAILNTQYRFQYKRVCKEGPVFDSHEVIW